MEKTRSESGGMACGALILSVAAFTFALLGSWDDDERMDNIQEAATANTESIVNLTAIGKGQLENSDKLLEHVESEFVEHTGSAQDRMDDMQRMVTANMDRLESEQTRIDRLEREQNAIKQALILVGVLETVEGGGLRFRTEGTESVQDDKADIAQ